MCPRMRGSEPVSLSISIFACASCWGEMMAAEEGVREEGMGHRQGVPEHGAGREVDEHGEGRGDEHHGLALKPSDPPLVRGCVLGLT